MTRRLSLVLTTVLAFGLVSLAAAQQQDQPSAAPNPLVQLLQNKGVLTVQEAAAINQASTPAEQQNRLTQLLYSKGIITQDEYKTTAAAAEQSRAWNSQGQGQGMWIQTAAHSPAGEPDAAVASAPLPPPAPTVIPAVAPVRVLTSDPPKAGGMVPDITLGSGAKLKLYGFVKSTAAYDTSNPYNIDFVLPGLDNVVAPSFPTAIPAGIDSGIRAIAGVGGSSFGPNGSPEFYLKASATRMGANFEWPDLAGSSNALTGRIETDFEGNFSRAQNRNVSSIRTRMLSLRLAWLRLDHQVSDKTTLFFLAGMDWTPFASSTQVNLLETTGGAAYFGSIYEREAQFRFGLWHDFGGPQQIKVGFEPTLGMPGFGDNSTDVGTQLGVSERDGENSARPEVSGRLVFQWQLDKAKGVAPAQIIFSGSEARRSALVNRASLENVTCGVASATEPTLITTCPAAVVDGVLASFPRGANATSNRWGADAEFQLPTRYFTWIGKYYTGADLKYYFGGQVYSAINYNSPGLVTTFNPTTGAAQPGVVCTGAGGECPIAFNVDASQATGLAGVVFGQNPVGLWQMMPEKPVRGVGGQTQLSFPLSRIFDANPAGRNAGWTLAFAAGIDEAKARDVRIAQPTGGRSRSDMAAATLNWKLNQYFNFAYELSLYRSFTTCFPHAAGGGLPDLGAGVTAATGGFPGPDGGLICSNTPFIQQPMTFGSGSTAVTLTNGAARAWHDLRQEFGPIVTF